LKTSGLFLGLSLIAVMLLIASYLFNNLSVALIAISMLITMTFSRMAFSREIRQVGFDARRTILDPAVFLDKPISVLLEMENKGAAQSVTIEDVLPENVELATGSNRATQILSRGEKAKVRYSVRPIIRGRIAFDEVKVQVNDRTGLFFHDISIPEESEVVAHIKEESIRKGMALVRKERVEVTHVSHQRWLRTRDYEFHGIREYVPGDRFRDIHWRSLAKLNKLLTKVYEREAMIPTTILLDCGRSMRLTGSGVAKVDHGIHLSLEIGKVLLAGNHPTGIVLFDEVGVVDRLAPSTKRGQFDQILSTLRKTPVHIDSSGMIVSEPADEEIVKPSEEKPEGDAVVSKDGEEFLSTIAAFQSMKGQKQTRVGLEGIMKAGIAKGRRKGQMYILISDLEACRDSIIRGAAMAAANEHQMVLATPFSYWYEGGEDEITIEGLEDMYESYETKLKTEKRLKSLGVLIVDIGPRDEAMKLTRLIRRKLS
jgi:uncharacterized protein (DUF58 family)